ncbi:MAG: peptidylprolyl isomerase [Candidatus Micrarchaeota archaeon]
MLLSFCLFGCVESGQPANNASNSINITGGNAMEEIVKAGDVVKVDYVGSYADSGKLFDTSIESEAKKAGLPVRPYYEPLEFTVGSGQMIKGFDKAVVGMKINEEKTITIQPEDAYGNRDENLVLIIDLNELTTQLGDAPKEGDSLQTNSGATGLITKIESNNVTVDFNHALADKTLVFKIIMKKIN